MRRTSESCTHWLVVAVPAILAADSAAVESIVDELALVTVGAIRIELDDLHQAVGSIIDIAGVTIAGHVAFGITGEAFVMTPCCEVLT